MPQGKISLTEEQAARIKTCRTAEELQALMAEFGHNMRESEARAVRKKPDPGIGKLEKWHHPGPE